MLHRLVHMTPVGFVDSGLGCVLGAMKALFLCGLIATFLSFAPADSFFRNQYQKSISAAPLVSFIAESIPFVKKAIIPLYKRFAPIIPEPDIEKDDETFSPQYI